MYNLGQSCSESQECKS